MHVWQLAACRPEWESRMATESLFRALLGQDFDRLPAAVQHLHRWQEYAQPRWQGRCSIERGAHPLARLCGWIAGLPPAREDVPMVVELAVSGDGEQWRRDFGGARMQSRLHARAGLLCERLGLVEFRFGLRVADGLYWQVHKASLSGLLPLPARWFDAVRSRESEYDGLYHFEVDAALPLLGRIVRYRGWLQPA